MSKINKKRPVYVLDTNVLLYNPRAVYAFPNADVVIPDTVLGELDKIKTARVDRELRYRSREISRILFELSENGKLTEGIPFGKNSLLRVVNYDPSKGKLDQFSSKNSDDRILTIVNQMKAESNGRPITIVTNDLNMLLKAQTLGIKVEHPGEEFAYSGIKRAWFKIRAQKKAILTTAAIVLVLAFGVYIQRNPDLLGLKTTNIPEGPPELVQQFQNYQNQVRALETQKGAYEAILKKKPRDLQALIGLGNIYFDLGNLNEDPNNFKKAIDYYEQALDVDPNQKSVRTDMAVAYYRIGISDKAIVELNKVISKDKKFYQAYFNLGVIMYQGENDPMSAKAYFQKAVQFAPSGSALALQANQFIKQIDAQFNMNTQTRTGNANSNSSSTKK